MSEATFTHYQHTEVIGMSSEFEVLAFPAHRQTSHLASIICYKDEGTSHWKDFWWWYKVQDTVTMCLRDQAQESIPLELKKVIWKLSKCTSIVAVFKISLRQFHNKMLWRNILITEYPLYSMFVAEKKQIFQLL